MCKDLDVCVTQNVPASIFMYMQQCKLYRTCDHFNGYAVFVSVFNGLLGVRAWGIEESKHAEHLPYTLIVGLCNS